MPPGVETRWASPENPSGARGAGGAANGGRKGSASLPMAAGSRRVMAEVAQTSGTIRRIWVTVSDRSPLMLRSLRLDIFWDGSPTSAVSAPLGDFFGTGLGRQVAFQSACFSSPEGRSFNCCLPMPFRTGMRVVITNESAKDLEHLYYDVDYTIGDRHDDDMLYLHAHWRRERRTTLQRDYEFLPTIRGRGRFLGLNVGVIADQGSNLRTWWGEGEFKAYIDGDRELPTLCGTGTEDYIGTAWELGRFDHLYQGCHLADHQAMRFCFYRYHIPDPVYFQRDLRVSMQQMGNFGPTFKAELIAAGRPVVIAGPERLPLSQSTAVHGLLERQDDWSSCAYVYLDRAGNDLPVLADVAERTAGLTGDVDP
ncbi:MAG: DUF2961 domain-containing protein [Planctomycetes bacterium]|nr:DUF2961 domain-containing protein [Planctomycetota bacterium]